MSLELALFAILAIVVFGSAFLVIVNDGKKVVAGVILAGIAIAKIVSSIDPTHTKLF